MMMVLVTTLVSVVWTLLLLTSHLLLNQQLQLLMKMVMKCGKSVYTVTQAFVLLSICRALSETDGVVQVLHLTRLLVI